MEKFYSFTTGASARVDFCAKSHSAKLSVKHRLKTSIKSSLVISFFLFGFLGLSTMGFGQTWTGYFSPTANIQNSVSTAANAYTSNNSRAEFNGTNDIVQYYNFNITGIPADATIQGIEVSIEGYHNAAGGRQFEVSLSYNAGTDYTSLKTTDLPGNVDNERYVALGNSTDMWGRTSWAVSELGNANFRIKLDATTSLWSCFADHVRARVYYLCNVPAQPSSITGITSPCLGSTQTYSVTNIPNVTYIWSFPTGWVQTGGGTGNSVTVTAGSGAGNVQVVPSNTCGTGPARALAVSPVTSVPAQCSIISGSATPCQGSSQTYSVTNVTGVTYSWTFPVGWTQTGGGTSNSVTVTVGSGTGNVQVVPSNNCGNGTASTLAVSSSTSPSQPTIIAGSSTPCQLSSQTYSVTNVSGVTYNWTFPSGWTQTGGGTSNSVTVTVGLGSGNVQVVPSNACGTGTARILLVSAITLPSQPSIISGSATPCQGSSQTYSVINVSGVTYNWTFPSGWTPTGGEPSNSVTVTVGSGIGNVEVVPYIGICSGTARTFAVSPITVPSQPTDISGSSTPCQGSSQTYSVTNVPGVTYTWTFPAGWAQTGGGTDNSVTVTVGSGSGNVQVVPSNTCGNGTASILAVVTEANSWQGGAPSGDVHDWNNPSNWLGGVIPDAGLDVIIPPGVNQPVIYATTAALCNNLTINPGASLTIQSTVTSSGSLIVGGTSNGIVTYNRALNNTNYHYFSSPVDSEIFPTSETILAYNEVSGAWEEPAACASGIGYTIEGVAELVFSGSLVTGDIIIPVTSPYADAITGGVAGEYDGRARASGREDDANYGGGGWNMLGNPYTSALNVSAFINENYSVDPADNKFDPNYVALYLYNGSSYNYVANSIGWPPIGDGLNEDHIQAGQGFFVLAMKDNTSFTFKRSMQGADTDADLLKSAKTEEQWPGLQLKVKHGNEENSTLVIFSEKMTAGLDPGYDVGKLSGNPAVDIYTSLAAKDNGVNFARQALPTAGADTLVVAVGIDSKSGGEVTFSATTVPFGNNKFWLEDRQTGTFTDLSTGTYSIILPEKTYGTGRFFILASANTPTAIKPVVEDGVRIWVSDDRVIIKGDVSDKARCEIYNVNGIKIVATRLAGGELNTIDMPSGSKGVYIVRVTDGIKVTTRKVALL